MLKRVFEIDLAHFLDCGGPVTVIAAIEAPAVMAEILAYLGLPTLGPPRSSARAFARFQRSDSIQNPIPYDSIAEPTLPHGD